MTEKQKKILKLSIAFSVAFAVYPTVNAMHIMEGYLPAGYCIAWGVVCLPFLVKGFFYHTQAVSGKQKGNHYAGHGGRLHICPVRT